VDDGDGELIDTTALLEIAVKPVKIAYLSKEPDYIPLRSDVPDDIIESLDEVREYLMPYLCARWVSASRWNAQLLSAA